MGKIRINTDSLRTQKDWKRHSVQPGSNIYRILPPHGDVEVHNNYPYKKWSLAWLVDPRTGRKRPFVSSLTDGDNECPVKAYQDALFEYINQKKAMLTAEGVTDKNQVREQLEPLYKVQWEIKVNHIYLYNACDKSGEVGLLELKSTAHKAMKKAMNDYIKDYGQDPTSLESDLHNDAGVWFNITKEGQGKQTEYGVRFNQTKKKSESGELLIVDDRSPLPENVVQNYDDLAYDLFTVYKKVSNEELKQALLFNIAIIAETIPEAVLPGYEEALEVSTEIKTETEAPQQEVVRPKTESATKVKLNLNDDDDDDIPFDMPKTTHKTTTSDSDLDDIKALADSVLGD